MINTATSTVAHDARDLDRGGCTPFPPDHSLRVWLSAPPHAPRSGTRRWHAGCRVWVV